MSSVIEIDINGLKHKVLPKDINFHPLNNEPVHIDFQKIKAGTKVTVNIPVKFINNEKNKNEIKYDYFCMYNQCVSIEKNSKGFR